MSPVRTRDLFRPVLRRLQPNSSPGLRKTFRLDAHARFLLDLFRVRFKWDAPPAAGGWHRRIYSNYSTYLRHQAGKLPRLDLTEYDRTFRQVLRDRLSMLPHDFRRQRVLCLGARIGSEVKAFIDLGAFAVGVDINPGESNAYVLHGDFHHLQFADDSVDVVFSNSVDHVFDLDRWTAEVRRVLAPNGLLIVELSPGIAEGGSPEFYESLSWDRVDDVLEHLGGRGFKVVQRRPFTEPNQGVQVLLAVES
jgi:SAM-dependent methyltransferase